MKNIFVIMVILSLNTAALAMSGTGEVSTECLMMKELNERNNPKALLSSAKTRPKQIRSGVTKQ